MTRNAPDTPTASPAASEAPAPSASSSEIIRHRPYPSLGEAGQAVVVAAIIANVLLAAGKFAVGILAQSAALIADGWNSLADVAHTAATLFALRWAAKPADRDHQYGHGNVETLASLVVGGILLATGVFIVVGAVQWVVMRGTQSTPNLWAAAMALIALITKGVLAHVTRRAGKATGSPLLKAAAADHRQDMLTSALVIVAIVAANLGLPWLDPLAALLVGLFIIGMTVATMRESLHILLAGVPLNTALVSAITAVADEFAEVHDMHNLKLMQVGAWTHVTVDLALDADLPVSQAHDIATRVADRIADISPGIGDIHVQIDPWVDGAVHDVSRHRAFHIDSPLQSPWLDAPVTPDFAPSQSASESGTIGG